MGGRWQQNLRKWQKMSEKREKRGQKVSEKLGKTREILYLCIVKNKRIINAKINYAN